MDAVDTAVAVEIFVGNNAAEAAATFPVAWAFAAAVAVDAVVAAAANAVEIGVGLAKENASPDNLTFAASTRRQMRQFPS